MRFGAPLCRCSGCLVRRDVAKVRSTLHTERNGRRVRFCETACSLARRGLGCSHAAGGAFSGIWELACCSNCQVEQRLEEIRGFAGDTPVFASIAWARCTFSLHARTQLQPHPESRNFPRISTPALTPTVPVQTSFHGAEPRRPRFQWTRE